LIRIDKYLKGDKVIWAVVILLSLFSLVMAYSASSNLAYRIADGDASQFLFRHARMIVLGLVIMLYVQNMNFKYLSKLSVIAIWVTAILLLVTLLFGRNVNSASRWIMGFQPSDLAKLMLVIYVARKLAMSGDKIKNFKEGLLPILIPMGLICMLILPANFSTAALLFATCFIMLFIAGAAIKHLAAMVGGAVALFGLLLLINTINPELLPRLNTWVTRISSFDSGNVEENYQATQAKLGIANGGIIGTGPGNGIIKNDIYSAQSDFVYAAALEEFGLIIAGIGILLAYIILFFRAIRIGLKAESKFGGFMVLGLSIGFILQALINMGVAVNLLPVTGQPLPLISMGGTSILFTCFALGIILSVSKTVYQENETEIENPVTA
jgi:cell division protein FtsW